MSTMAIAGPAGGLRGNGSTTLFAEFDRPRVVNQESNSTLLSRQRPAWLHQAVVYVLDAIATRDVSDSTAALAGGWLLTLPSWVPTPSIGIGDDASISIEWERAGKVLHVMFDQGSIESYFADSESGEEWEMTVAADTGLLLHALRLIVPGLTH